MKRFLDALFSPSHAVIAVIVAWFGTAIIAGAAVGLWQPDYRRILVVVIIVYWATVVSEMGLFGRRRNGS
jgi:hypothetical protein